MGPKYLQLYNEEKILGFDLGSFFNSSGIAVDVPFCKALISEDSDVERKLLFLGLYHQRLLLHDDEQTVMKTLAVQHMGQRSQAYIVHKCTGTALYCTYHIAHSSVCTACL